MAITKLDWQQLMPPTPPLSKDNVSLDALADLSLESSLGILEANFPRFCQAFELFMHPKCQHKILLAQANESTSHLSLIEETIIAITRSSESLLSSSSSEFTALKYPITQPQSRVALDYQYQEGHFQRVSKERTQSALTDHKKYHMTAWIEMQELFGGVHQLDGKVSLSEGVLHQINGGMLVVTAGTLLSNPLMFVRLLKILETGYFEWLSAEEGKIYPVTIDPIPMDFKLIIVGERDNLDGLLSIEPNLLESSIYSEIERVVMYESEPSFFIWQAFITYWAHKVAKVTIKEDVWHNLHRLSTRQSGDQFELTICPKYWQFIFYSLLPFIEEETVLSLESFEHWYAHKEFIEGNLAQRIYSDFAKDQIYIDVEGKIVGQINGMAVLSYPGHPVEIGEPSRITCIVHLGDGEVNDVERKVDLGGNIHAKGLLIMQAFLFSALDLAVPFPLSASIVFEQSYSEVDGDSASLAELCALMSALSQVPIDQQIAITGSVDQMGQVQPIGGVNEKIEGFFKVCQQKGLTGQQGVIIPLANQYHLSLSDEVIEAVQAGEFHVWVVSHVSEAIELLTSIKYCSENDEMDLLSLMQQKILQSSEAESTQPWYRRIFDFSK